MDLGTQDLVWYVAYGSNLSAARFGCYLAGGCPPGSFRTYEGCRDRSPPRRADGVLLPGGLTFAGASSVWGGGMAFFDPTADATVAARAYQVTFGQFSDIVAQEARHPVAEDLVLSEGTRQWPTPSGVYETVLHLDDRNGLPMLTITSLQELDPKPPTAAYLRMVLAGLGEAFGWEPDRCVAYLLGARGITPEWTPEALTALCDGVASV